MCVDNDDMTTQRFFLTIWILCSKKRAVSLEFVSPITTSSEYLLTFFWCLNNIQFLESIKSESIRICLIRTQSIGCLNAKKKQFLRVIPFNTPHDSNVAKTEIVILYSLSTAHITSNLMLGEIKEHRVLNEFLTWNERKGKYLH